MPVKPRAGYLCRPIRSSARDTLSMRRRGRRRPKPVQVRARRSLRRLRTSGSACTRRPGRATNRCLPAAPHVRGVWIVFADRGPLADAVVDRLQAAGATSIVAEAGTSYAWFDPTRFQIRAGDPADVAALVLDIAGSHGPVAGAIVLWDLPAADAAWVGYPTRGYAALVALAAALDARSDGTSAQVIAVSAGAQSVLDEPVVRPEAGLLTGPVLVLPTEMPGIRIRNVDLEAGGEMLDVCVIARILVAEAAADTDENFTAWRRGRRWVRRYQPVNLPAVDPAELPVKQRGAYLITGGLGGIGLALAAWLAKAASARLLLTSRRSLPPRQTWDALLAEPAGDARTVAIIQCDPRHRSGGRRGDDGRRRCSRSRCAWRWPSAKRANAGVAWMA